MKPEYLLIAAVVVIAPVAALIALRFWMSSPSEVLEEVMYSPSGQGVASAVAIGISFKRWRA